MATNTDTTTDLGFDEPITITSIRHDSRRENRNAAGNPDSQNRDSESSRVEPSPNGSSPESLGGIPIIDTFDFGADPVTINGTDTGGATPGSIPIDGARRRRGRPLGSKNRSSTDPTGINTEKTSPNLANLEAMLYSIHMMGARLLAVPELELEEKEAKKLADAMAEVAKHYNFGMDSKKLAIANLIFCAGGIYGSRAIQVYKRKSSDAPKVLHMPGPVTRAKAEGEQAGPIQRASTQARDLRTVTPSEIWNASVVDDFVL